MEYTPVILFAFNRPEGLKAIITWVRYKQINISLKIRNIAIKVLNL